MTQGRKRTVILVAILVILLAALWGYLTLTGSQSEDLGYLVRANGYGMGNAAEYESGQRTEYGVRTEKEYGAEPGFRAAETAGIKYKEEGKDCHG